MRKLVLAVAIAAMPISVIAAEDELVGTWKVVSFTRKILDTGEVVNTFGKNPKGFITYGKDGRMLTLGVSDERPKAESLDKITDQQRIQLFNTMVAYGGTYKFDGKRVEHHIDISANEVWTGTTQVRDVTRDGDKLVLTTPQFRGQDGKVAVITLVWEKVK
jgi:hypothetical protein